LPPHSPSGDSWCQDLLFEDKSPTDFATSANNISNPLFERHPSLQHCTSLTNSLLADVASADNYDENNDDGNKPVWVDYPAVSDDGSHVAGRSSVRLNLNPLFQSHASDLNLLTNPTLDSQWPAGTEFTLQVRTQVLPISRNFETTRYFFSMSP
jgi:hypothetical protein